jgi:hypothetical protein
MIHLALRHLANQLNQYLMRTLAISDEIAVVSNVVGPDGVLAPNLDNKVILVLTSIERDTVPVRSPEGAGRMLQGSAPMFLNLYVMVAANFKGDNYPEALKFIALAITFFQQQTMFDRRNTPDLDHGIEKLILDIENLTRHEMSNVWGLLGGRYLPSVLYRVRMVTIDPDDIHSRTPVITRPAAGVGYSGGNN